MTQELKQLKQTIDEQAELIRQLKLALHRVEHKLALVNAKSERSYHESRRARRDSEQASQAANHALKVLGRG